MSIGKILFHFSGRIPRSTYWLAMLGIWAGLFAFAFIAGFLSAVIRSGHEPSGPSTMMPLLVLLMYVCALWSTLAVTVKRWHDRGKSGSWVLINFLPIIGPLWSFIELGFLEGTQGPNEYDENYFSKNFLLADDDPALSAPQLAGRQ
jgi:uncharacterized membrane protein YhaH (DUF805 family)